MLFYWGSIFPLNGSYKQETFRLLNQLDTGVNNVCRMPLIHLSSQRDSQLTPTFFITRSQTKELSGSFNHDSTRSLLRANAANNPSTYSIGAFTKGGGGGAFSLVGSSKRPE